MCEDARRGNGPAFGFGPLAAQTCAARPPPPARRPRGTSAQGARALLPFVRSGRAATPLRAPGAPPRWASRATWRSRRARRCSRSPTSPPRSAYAPTSSRRAPRASPRCVRGASRARGEEAAAGRGQARRRVAAELSGRQECARRGEGCIGLGFWVPDNATGPKSMPESLSTALKETFPGCQGIKAGPYQSYPEVFALGLTWNPAPRRARARAARLVAAGDRRM